MRALGDTLKHESQIDVSNGKVIEEINEFLLNIWIFIWLRQHTTETNEIIKKKNLLSVKISEK